jgi:hypothetical protein
MQSCRSSARSYGTRTLRGTRSRLALMRRTLRELSWHAGRRPRVATVASDGRFMGQLFDWEGLLGHKRPTGMMSIFGVLAFHCHYEAEGGALALSGPLPGGRAQGTLCVERPFLTSAIMELRVPQVRRLPLCISRVRTTHKYLALCEGLGHPCPLIFARAICATHAHSPSARSIGFCAIWVCISSSSSSSSSLMCRSWGIRLKRGRNEVCPSSRARNHDTWDRRIVSSMIFFL